MENQIGLSPSLMGPFTKKLGSRLEGYRSNRKVATTAIINRRERSGYMDDLADDCRDKGMACLTSDG